MNAFTSKPDVSKFVKTTRQSLIRQAGGKKAAQKANVLQAPEMRLFTKKERNDPR